MSAELIDGIPATEYHAHDSLSASGAKLLLPPSCPAKYRAKMDAEPEHKGVWDFGKVVHTLVLGDGEDFEVVYKVTRDKQRVPAEDYATKSAAEHAAEIRAAGKVPIFEAQHATAVAVAESVKRHRIAAALFASGKAEQSAFWSDPRTGVQRRARFDWLPDKVEGRRLIVPDLKTARSAEPWTFGRAAADYGYAMQAAWYLDAVRALGLDPDPAFVFVVVEKEPPYVVTVCQLDDEAMHVGRSLNRTALRIYAECKATDTWPGYSDDIATVSLPGYFIHRSEEIAS
jgi:hypothetical protein